MAWPIVIVPSGGLPVTEASNGFGTPVESAANGFGTPVTVVASGGLPVVGVAATYVAPFNGSLGIWGDSLLANGYTIAGVTRQYNDTGFDVWGQAFAGSGLSIPSAGQRAVIGETTTQILARLAAINAAACNIVLLDGGTNDVLGSVAAATIIANRSAMNAGCTANLIIACTIPKPIGAAALTGAQELIRQAANTGIRAQASSRVIIFDLDTIVGDNGAAYYGTDGLHFDVTGAYLVGKQLATVLAAHTSSSSTFAALLAAADYGANKTLVGTGGSLTTATGVVADGTELSGSGAGGATVVGAKDGTGAQLITLSGNYSGTNRTVVLQQYFAATPANGDVIEGLARIKVSTDFAATIAAIQYYCVINDAGFAQLSYGFTFASAAELSPLVAADGILNLRTPPTPIPAGNAPAYVQNYVAIQFKDQVSATAVSGALSVLGMSARKVDLS